MIGVNFGVTDRLLRNWGACVDTIFLTCVKEGDFNEGKVADLKETKRCTGSGSADEAEPTGQKEYSMKMLIRAVW